MLTRADIEAALNTVIDPCSLVAGVRAGLVDMGLVTAIEVETNPVGSLVRVQIGLTEPGCLMGHAFVPKAQTALSRLEGVIAVEVRLDPTLIWDETKMTEEYRQRLEYKRTQKRPALSLKVT